MEEGFVPSDEGMPPEFAEAEGDAELQDTESSLETTTSDLRSLWADWLCHRGSGAFADPKFFGRSIGGVPAPAVDAYRALEGALRSSGYQPSSSWAYNCRNIAGTDRYSLHSYGVAIDIDPAANPYTSGDPYAGRLKPNHVRAVLAIKNSRGHSVWAWGGSWRKPDRMHFQLDQGPTRVDVDWSTVPGSSGPAASSASTAVAATTTTMNEEEPVLTRGAKGTAVERFQTALKAWNAGALPEHGVDGGYGSETIDWVKQYQEAMGLPVTGNIDGVTAAVLMGEL